MQQEDMAEKSNPQKVDTGLVAVILRSYVAKNSVAVDQLASLITTELLAK
jgi:hypothetical protein